MHAEKPRKPDFLTLLARAQRKDRQRSVRGLALALVLLAVGLGFVLWLCWPKGTPANLETIAFDQAVLPDQVVRVRAQLQPVDPAEAAGDLSGFELHFADSLLEKEPANRGKGLRGKATTGADGEASFAWRLPFRPEPYPLVVRYAGDDQHSGSFDAARVFSWQARTPLLVIETRHALMDAGEAQFRRSNQFALPAFDGAAETLKAVQGKKYQIVYLAVAPSRVQEYRKLRSWLQRPGPAGDPLFPAGPALARENYPSEETEAAAQRATLRLLKDRFQGRMVGVVRRPEDAKTFHEAGLTTFRIGAPGKDLEGVKTVPGWKELVNLLPEP